MGFLMYTQMFMHVIAHRGGTDTAGDSALKVDWEKNPLMHLYVWPVTVTHVSGFSDPVIVLAHKNTSQKYITH